MHHTYTTHILTQLRSAGFSVEKCLTEKEWQLTDGGKKTTQKTLLLRSSSLGELTKKSAKEFGLDWK